MRAKSHYYEFGPFRLEPGTRLLWRADQIVDLFPQTFDLLLVFVENAGRLVTKAELHKWVWGRSTFVGQDSLPQAVSSLRKTLLEGRAFGCYIETVPKRGYRFVAEVRETKPTALIPSGANLLPRDEMYPIIEKINNNRVTTIVAPQGYGKTSLAILTASELQTSFRDGVWFVPFENLGEAADETAVVEAISSVLGENTEHQTIGALVRLIQEQDLLLILDACETVAVDWSMVVSSLLLACPNIKVLATSRRPLGVSGEYLHRLAALQVPSDKVDDWSALDGFLCATMFSETALRHGCSLSRDGTTAFRVASICRLAEGVPRVIELAASMTYQQSLDEILDGLRSDFRLGGSQEKRLNRALLRSYRSLSGPSKSLFKRLSVFMGGFTKVAAESIRSRPAHAKQDSSALEELVESSLVSRSSVDRYHILHSTRGFALSLSWAEGEVEALSRSHFDFYRNLAESIGKQVVGRDILLALEEMQAELPNVMRALDWALRNAPEDGAALCASLWPYWVVTGQFTEGRAQLKSFLAAAQGSPPATLVRAWTGLGILAYFQSDYQEGIAFCDKGLELARTVSDQWAATVNWIAGGGMRLTMRGEPSIAFRYFDQSIELATQLADKWLLSLATGNWAMYKAAFISNDTAHADETDARDVLVSGDKSVLLGRQSDNPWVLAFALMNFAMALRFLEGGRAHDRYESLVREAFELRRKIGDKYGMIQSLFALAMVACEREVASEYIRAAVLLGAVQRLIAGRERIPIPKHNEPFYLLTISKCKLALGEEVYQDYFWKGTGLSLPEITDIA